MDIARFEEQRMARPNLLRREEWSALEREHEVRADKLSARHRERRLTGTKHPIEDFLWTYYSFKPADLRRWHPGAGVVLDEAMAASPSMSEAAIVSSNIASGVVATAPRESWRYYQSPGGRSLAVDLPAYFAKREASVDFIADLLSRTINRPPHFACFGLHEWAMVYRSTPEDIRHSGLPLRIGPEATNSVVESHPISCSHFDAYRFFTPEARPLNRQMLTRNSQIDDEQSGCLHAGMDIYKWVTKLGPIIPGDLLLDSFELARDIRTVDMQASPYDVSQFGLPAIAIETVAGKREYAQRQRGFTDRGNELRIRVLSAISVARSELARVQVDA